MSRGQIWRYVKAVQKRVADDFGDEVLLKVLSIGLGCGLGLAGGTYPLWVREPIQPGPAALYVALGALVGFVPLFLQAAARMHADLEAELKQATRQRDDTVFLEVKQLHEKQMDLIRDVEKGYPMHGGLRFREALFRGKQRDKEQLIKRIRLAQEGTTFDFDPLEVLKVEQQGFTRQSIIGTAYEKLVYPPGED